jgi:antitoxin Xre/MbcA/ParS-like protein
MDPSALRPGRAEASRPAVVLTRAVTRAADLLGFSQKELSAVLGLSPATVSRLGRRPLDPRTKEGELGVLFVRLYRSLDALLGGNVEACRRWFHAHNHHLEARPAELVQTVTGLVHVIEYLDAMRGKV